MKLNRYFDVLARGEFPGSPLWRRATDDIEGAIAAVDWPPGSGTFSLNPTPAVDRQGRPDRHPNGVMPIKLPMLHHLQQCGWLTEALPPLPPGQLLRTGDLDALLLDAGVYVGFEWETGNVSSSHRAISKLLDALSRGTISGGVLVLSVRATQRYLTDRVGNYEELEPYFEFWGRHPVADGVLRIYGVEHDELDDLAPYIPKGTDGRALG